MQSLRIRAGGEEKEARTETGQHKQQQREEKAERRIAADAPHTVGLGSLFSVFTLLFHCFIRVSHTVFHHHREKDSQKAPSVLPPVSTQEDDDDDRRWRGLGRNANSQDGEKGGG